MELDVIPGFPTLIGRLLIPDAGAMNRDLQAIILAEEIKYPSLGRSNIGGWHSRPDFLCWRDPAVAALTSWLNWTLRRMIEASVGSKALEGTLSVSAWATLCRAGAYHAPHSHPDSAWSGVYYVDAGSDTPDQPLSGVLEFLDPRAGVDAVTAPGDPYGEPFRVRPQAGLLIVFPSFRTTSQGPPLHGSDTADRRFFQCRAGIDFWDPQAYAHGRANRIERCCVVTGRELVRVPKKWEL